MFSDGIFVVRTNEISHAACGAKLVAVEGVPAEKVFARVTVFVSAESHAWRVARTPELMTCAEVLFVAGIYDARHR